VSGIPDEYDLESLGEGQALMTPVGEVYRENDGSYKLALNQQGKIKYEAMRQDLTKRFGWHPAHGDPLAPQPEIIPGLPNFNPFAPADRAWTE
jgi:hypothetical protein